jgi:hypothetical protein
MASTPAGYVLTEATPPPERWFRPVADTHITTSRRLIAQAAEQTAANGQTVVIGAGACREIPLVDLAERFGDVVLNDVDAAALDSALESASLSTAQQSRVRRWTADVTGVSAKLQADLPHAAPPDAGDPALTLAPWLTTWQPPPIALPSADLVVASCVLGQLHIPMFAVLETWFAQRFPQAGAILTHPPLRAACFALRQRMEEDFVAALARAVRAGGRVFLSETTHFYPVRRAADGGWLSPGCFRMMVHPHLENYLDPAWRIEAAESWFWLTAPPTPETITRCYTVRGLILSRS